MKYAMTKRPKSMFGHEEEHEHADGTEKAGNKSELPHIEHGSEEVPQHAMKSMGDEHPYMEGSGEVLHPKLEMLMKSLEDHEAEEDKPSYKGGYVGMRK